jgi:hypothetical protein
MAVTTPLLQGQQRQLDDYASLTAAETPSQQEQQSPTTMAKMPAHQGQQCNREQQSPSQQWQRCLRINGNNAIMARATTPALQRAMRAKIIDNSTTVETPVHQQWQ